MTEKQHSEHTGRTRLLCILAMPPQARPHIDDGGSWEAQGAGGGPQEQACLRIGAYSSCMGGRILSPRERSFQLFSVIDPLTTDAMSLEFMDGIPEQKAFDMVGATCGKQLLSNTKAGSGGSAGGQARHRPQGR